MSENVFGLKYIFVCIFVSERHIRLSIFMFIFCSLSDTNVMKPHKRNHEDYEDIFNLG